MCDKLFRRHLLKAGVGFIAGAAGTTLFGDFSTVLAKPLEGSFGNPIPQPPSQGDWRYCVKCQALFYQGNEGSTYDRRRGVCAAGGAHEPAGYNFTLIHDVPGTPKAQTDWRYCNKCQELFYEGARDTTYDQRRGVCAAGGAHEPAGYHFVLEHDVPSPETSGKQTDWRYCVKCQAMFYQGAQGSTYDQRKGVCAVGGVHEPAGYNFALSLTPRNILR